MSCEGPSTGSSGSPRAAESQYCRFPVDSLDVELAKRMRELNVSNNEPFSDSSSTLQILHSSGFTVEKYRVGSPPLNLLPLRSSTVNPQAPENLAVNGMLPTIKKILNENNVDMEGSADTNIDFVHRTFPWETECPRESMTIIISALWDDAAQRKWLNTVEKIRAHLKANALTQHIKVEIISWELEAEKMLLPIERSHPLVDAWPTIRPLLHDIFAQSYILRIGWRSIDVLRVGYPLYTQLPYPVVVSVTVDWKLDPIDWNTAEKQVQELLIAKGFPQVQVSFERGEVGRHVFQLRTPQNPPDIYDVIEDDYKFRLSISADFGAAKYFQRLGSGILMNGPYATLGGYLSAREGQKPPIKLGLTNYHAVRETVEGFEYIDSNKDDFSLGAAKAMVPAGSILDKIDKGGMGPNYTARNMMKLESPSRRKHNMTMTHLHREIRRHEERVRSLTGELRLRAQADLTASKQSYEEKKKFFDQDKQPLGVPWMCSGFLDRTKTGSRLDYCLIEMDPARIGDNRIPDKSAWIRPFRYPICYGQQMRGIASCSTSTQVFKIGARTGATSGTINGIKSDVKMDWDDVLGIDSSSEYMFIGEFDEFSQRHALFSLPGDSGSMIFDDTGAWVGLAFGGAKKQQASTAMPVYVTDAQTLLDEMHQKSGGKYTFELATS